MLFWNRIRRYGSVVSAELTALSLWWWRELKDLLVALVDRLQPNRLTRVELVVGAKGVTIKARKAQTPLEDITLMPNAAGQLPASLAEFWPVDRPQRINVEVALSPEKVLVRQVTLPTVSDRDLGKILDLRLERELPLGRERVYVDWAVTHRDQLNRKIVAAIGIVRRSEIDPILAALREWGWKPVRVGLIRDAQVANVDPLQFNFLITERDPRALVTSNLNRPLATCAAVLAVLVLVTLCGQWLYERNQVGEALASAQAQLKAQANQRAQLVKTSEAAAALRKLMATPSAANVLSDLSALLPTDSWVSDLEIQSQMGGNPSMRLVGYTPTATELVNRIEESERFSNVELASATSAGVATQSERVELSAVGVPPTATPESGS